MMDYYYTTLAFILSYLLGSIPFGLLLTKLAGLGDIRKIGSGNIGATNVLRTGRKDIAALTLLFDILKGTIAPVLAFIADPFGGSLTWAAVGVFLGHLFPVWLKFKGGKGVATYIGLLLIGPSLAIPLGEYSTIWPFAGFIITWLVVAYISGYSSLAAISAALVTPLIIGLWDWQTAAWYAFFSLLLIAKHHENIRRLIAGTEGKISFKKS